jgi:hypothetical protein
MAPFYAVETNDKSLWIVRLLGRLMQLIGSNGRQKTSAMKLIDAVR